MSEDDIQKKNKVLEDQEKSKLPIYDLDVDNIRPNDYNVNEMSDEKFSLFIEQIQEKGFDVPIIVVENYDEDTDTDYMIIDGEHRWRAGEQLGFETLPAIIKQSLTEDDYMTEPTRRNTVTGTLNPHKTETLIEELKHEWEIDDNEVIAEELGLTDKEEKEEYIIQETVNEQDVEEDIEEEIENESSENEISMVDDISSLLNKLLDEYGETIPQSFMAFSHPNGGVHMLVGMSSELKTIIKKLAFKFQEESINADEFFIDLLEQKVQGYEVKDDEEFKTDFKTSRYED